MSNKNGEAPPAAKEETKVHHEQNHADYTRYNKDFDSPYSIYMTQSENNMNQFGPGTGSYGTQNYSLPPQNNNYGQGVPQYYQNQAPPPQYNYQNTQQQMPPQNAFNAPNASQQQQVAAPAQTPMSQAEQNTPQSFQQTNQQQQDQAIPQQPQKVLYQQYQGQIPTQQYQGQVPPQQYGGYQGQPQYQNMYGNPPMHQRDMTGTDQERKSAIHQIILKDTSWMDPQDRDSYFTWGNISGISTFGVLGCLCAPIAIYLKKSFSMADKMKYLRYSLAIQFGIGAVFAYSSYKVGEVLKTVDRNYFSEYNLEQIKAYQPNRWMNAPPPPVNSTGQVLAGMNRQPFGGNQQYYYQNQQAYTNNVPQNTNIGAPSQKNQSEQNEVNQDNSSPKSE
ncbi:unnamed protein product [Moneuplotes crassus]|uniref:Uncharacterized protein n=1 Tax=Euplotes crassus TaxID=5936 RepID=A0AAD1UNG7_EUPCR|nr:unnamed protein product [Moneuplotes crassus]